MVLKLTMLGLKFWHDEIMSSFGIVSLQICMIQDMRFVTRTPSMSKYKKFFI